MTNLLENAIGADDGDWAAKLIRNALGIESMKWRAIVSRRRGRRIVGFVPASSAIG